VRARLAHRHPEKVDPWTAKMLERKPVRLATVAMANSERRCATGSSTQRTERIIWAVLTRDTEYRRSTA